MPPITLLQTADPEVYREMLECTSRINRRYAERYGFDYVSVLGIERGFHPWHACFNRILIIARMIAEGRQGWVFYLDADAYVFGQDFDVRDLIAAAGKPMIFGPGGSEGPWDVNDGVFLMNLEHPIVREVVSLWREDFLDIPEADMRAAPEWGQVTDDQRLLHAILESRWHLLAGLSMAERSFFNDYHATFVRQALRGHGFSIAERVAMIRRDAAACLRETVALEQIATGN